MIVKLRLFSLNNSHELIYLNFEAIEICAVHSIKLMVHEMLENSVDSVGIIAKF